MINNTHKAVRYHVEDNTVLDCPTASYKYNWNSYNNSRKLILIISCLLIIICSVLIFVIKDTRFVTILSTFIGGLLGLLVWLVTTFITDKMNREIANIDRLILDIDKKINLLHQDVIIEDEDSYDIVNASNTKQNNYYRFIFLLQNCSSLLSDKNLDLSELILKWEDKEYNIEDFCQKLEGLLSAKPFVLDLKHQKMVEWNFDELDYHLTSLKEKLLRYKTYILETNPPAPFPKKH